MEQTIKEDSKDMCQRIIAAIASKFIDAATEEHQQLDITFLLPRHEDECKRITISHDKEQETFVSVSPLKKKIGSGDKMWEFIENNLPDYYHRDDILHYDIYSRFIDNEEVCEDDLQWIYEGYGSDKQLVQEELDKMEKQFAYEALLAWLDNNK